MMDHSAFDDSIPIYTPGVPGTLKSLVSKLAKQTETIDSYLRSLDSGRPSFDVLTDKLPDTAEYTVLRGDLASTLDELKYLVDGPKLYLRSLLMTGNDLAAFQVAFEFKFFQIIPLNTGIDVGTLAIKVGMDVDRATRVLRMLATHRVFLESRPCHFSHTAASALLHSDEEIRCAGHYMLDECLRAATMAAACIKDSPDESDGKHSPFHTFFGMPMFSFYERNPMYAARFAKAMAGTTKLDRQTSGLRHDFPWEQLQGTVIDVGGGNGHVSMTLARAFPGLRFLVQDNSELMLAQGKRLLEPSLHNRVSFMKHDFFTRQPQLQDTAAYLIRQCTHNWSDADLVTILRALVPGLESAEPRIPLLINDTVMTVPGSRPLVDERALRQIDMLMFVVLGSKQRSVAEFKDVLKKADERYEIEKVHSEGAMGLIEVRLRTLGVAPIS
ncbi:O-methyltransferase [Xylaria curta]|nr:O-methyltransferase [Xylaria curta]